jgi:HAD superfamily hydrolase (TIGR01450 family)
MRTCAATTARAERRAIDVLPSFSRWFDAHHTKFDALVLDIDGILLLNRRPVPGSIEFLAWLRRQSYPFALLTNDGNHSIAEKRRFLRESGVHVREQEITSCSDGLVELAARLRLAGKRFFVIGDLGKPNYALRAGLRITRSLCALEDCDGVIVGESNYDWEKVINGVVNYFIRRTQSHFIVPNPDECYPSRGGLRIAAGGTARFIQRVLATQHVHVEPIYLGKPHRLIFEHNHALMERRLGRHLAKRRVLMLGDSLSADVRGALDFGYRSALFLTGLTTETTLRRSAIKPDLVFRGF